MTLTARPSFGTATVIHSNALHLPLADDSVDLICTSPPFLNLRSYQDSGEHYDGQISTGTRDEFLTKLLDATAEMKRVLKPSGSIFVELGDSYSNKSLNLSPHRYAIGCTDSLGLILRAEIIWSRPNGLPESVTDRVRRNHSTWFHFTREPRYYSAIDEIREASVADPDKRRGDNGWRPVVPDETRAASPTSRLGFGNPLGKLPSSVWQIATQPLIVPPELGIDHFASFPMELPRRIITGWSPRHVCMACGEGRRPIVDAERTPRPTSGPLRGGANRTVRDGHPGTGGDAGNMMTRRTITGYACGCPDTSAPTTPGVILDSFGGTGTTAVVAKALGRNAITIDASADYCRLATWRTNDPRELAKARQEPFTPSPEPADGQDALFTLDAS